MFSNSPYSSPIFRNENVVYRMFPLTGDGTQENKLKFASVGLSTGQTWGWDGTQWAAYSLGGASALPPQTGQAGKFLTTNGTAVSWAAVNSAVWGNITGTLTNQTDLNTALGLKADLISPSFTTPTLGAASATTINKVTLTAPATGSTLTIADGKTLTASNTLTLTGTDASSIAFGSGGTVAYTDVANTFAQNQIISFTSISATPSLRFTGAWHTSSGTTNTKPHVLIEPAGTTSTNWSTNGTGLGINAASGFAGNLLDLQIGGVVRLSVNGSGGINALGTITTTAGSISAAGNISTSGGNVIAGASGFIGISGKTGFNSSIAGLLNVTNQNDNNFERLQLGGSTSTSPALQIARSNAQTGLAATFTNGSADIGTATNTYAANDVVQFTTTGGLPTGFAINTNYFIVGSPTSTIIQVSATSGGSAISAASAGSGTHTVVRQTSATISNGSSTWTSTFAHGLRVGDVIRFSSTPPTNFLANVDYYVLTIPSTTTFTLSLNFGGTTISAGSAVSTAIVFTRNVGIYVRAADNSATASLYAGNIVGNAPTGYAGRVFDLRVGNSTVFNIDQVGNLVTGGSITGAINITAAFNIICGSGNYFQINSRTRIQSAADGNLLLQSSAGGDFGLLQLGSATSSFPAIKRNGATIETRLADDSGFAAVQTLYGRFGAGSPEGVVTAPIGAFYSRTDGGAGTSFYVKESGTGNTGWVAK